LYPKPNLLLSLFNIDVDLLVVMIDWGGLVGVLGGLGGGRYGGGGDAR